MRVVLIGLLFLFQLNCGGMSGDMTSSGGGGGGGGGGGVSVGKGVSVEGNVTVPLALETEISAGSDSAGSSSVSKSAASNSAVTETSAESGEICCKRYDGTTVASGVVDHSGEIVETIVSPSSLDSTQQIICKAELEDGRTLLNHYDLTGKVEGDRVRVDASVDSTIAVEQVLLKCGPETTFENMEECATGLRREDFHPRKLFEKFRDKMEKDSAKDKIAAAYQNVIEAVESGMTKNPPTTLGDIREILKGHHRDFFEASDQIRKFAEEGENSEPVEETLSEEAAGKIVMQTPYGLDKTRDRSEQGNLGRPLMGEPYGHDKDAAEEEKTTPRGRPFRYAEGEEPPPPEPPPPEPAPIILEAPIDTQLYFSAMSSGWDLAVTPAMLGGARYQSFSRSISWNYVPDPNIAGFHVYDKMPGESAFRLLLSKVISYSLTSGNLINVWLPGSGGIRMATDWPLGTYESYVVAYDVEGKEGPAGEIATATNLGEIQWLRPTEGQILETYFPTFQWSNIWPEEIQTSGGSGGWTEFIVSDEGSIYNIYHAGNVGWSTTSWRGANLTAGHQYYAVLNSGVFAAINGARHFYLAYSRLVGFSAQ